MHDLADIFIQLEICSCSYLQLCCILENKLFNSKTFPLCRLCWAADFLLYNIKFPHVTWCNDDVGIFTFQIDFLALLHLHLHLFHNNIFVSWLTKWMTEWLLDSNNFYYVTNLICLIYLLWIGKVCSDAEEEMARNVWAVHL